MSFSNKTTFILVVLCLIATGCFAVRYAGGISVQSPINMNYGTITNLGTSGGDYEAVNGSYLRSSLQPIYNQLGSALTTGNDYGRSGVSTDLYEGTAALYNKYLGISAKAADADQLDGNDSSDFQKRISGTCSSGSSIRVIYSDGTVTCETDDLGVTTATDYGRSGVSNTLYEGTTALSSNYLGKTAKAVDANTLYCWYANCDSTDFVSKTGKAYNANYLDYHDSSYFQRRVGRCYGSQVIRRILSSGGVWCQTIVALWERNPLTSNALYYPGGNVAIGKSHPNYSLDIKGTLAVSGTKNFVIDHPTKENTKLVHSTLEGPEAAVFYRGEAQLTNGKAIVELPEYFEALTRKEGRTVLLTPKSEPEEIVSHLAALPVKDGKFKVKAIDSNNPNQEFYWEVKAVRADVPPLIEVQLPPGS